MDLFPVFIDPVEAPHGRGFFPGHMITIVGKGLARCETGRLPDDLVCFNHKSVTINVFDDPLSSQKRDGPV